MERNTTRMDDVDVDDRISQLPELIAIYILYFLKDSHADLVRMSVLSKDWFTITACFPILDFNMDNFTKDIIASRVPYDTSHVKNMFFKHVEYTTSRFCNQQNILICIYALNFNGLLLENPSHLSIVGRCIRLILRKGGLQLLKVDINTVSPLPKYCFPHILLSVSSLSDLIIQHCELPSSLMLDDAIKFNSLKLLHLERVNINEQLIKRLITCCPLLEKFKLLECRGFKRICINGLQNLQEVQLDFKVEVASIDIDAPNLWYLFLVDRDERGVPHLNLASCKKLTTLFYGGNPLSKFKDVEEPKVIDSPPFQLEHVDLELWSHGGTIKEFRVYVAAVDAVLWYLCPRSLTLNSDFHFLEFEQRSHIVKFTYEKLLQQEDEGQIDIQIVLSISSSKDKKHLNDLNSLLAALPHDPLRHIITFVKEDPNSGEVASGCMKSRNLSAQKDV